MPSTVLSSLVNIDALNAAYLMLKRQMDERVYRTDIYPDEVLGSTDLPYKQAYFNSINNNTYTWYINNTEANFANLKAKDLTTSGNTTLGGTVNITGNTSVSGTLGVTGATTISNTLNVTGSATFNEAQITGNLNVRGAINATGDVRGARVWNAVWNDIADAITVEDQAITFEPGYAYAYNGREWFKTKDKNSPYFGIHSDTAGYILGYDPNINQILIAVGGFVLAHVDKLYESGTFLTYGKDGILTKAKRKDEKIAKFFKEEKRPLYKGREVMGRHWIKIL